MLLDNNNFTLPTFRKEATGDLELIDTGGNGFFRPTTGESEVDSDDGSPIEDEKGSKSDDFGIESNNDQQNVTDDDDSRTGLSTDLQDMFLNFFGSYGEVMFEVLNNLFDVFGQGTNSMFDVSNDLKAGEIGSANIFRNFVATIDAIVRKLNGSDSQRLNNVVNAYSSVMGYYFNILSSMIQNQFNVQQWMIEADYNSPKEQLKRLADAGLNPLHYFNNSSNQSGSIQASNIGSPSMSPASGLAKAEEKKMKRQQILEASQSLAGNIQSGFQNYAQSSQLSFDRQRVANETAKTRQDISESEARRINTEVTTEGLAQGNAYNKENYPLQLKELAGRIQLQSKEGKIKEEELNQLVEGTKLMIQEFKFKEGLNAVTLRIQEKEFEKVCEVIKQVRTATDYQNWQYQFEKATGIPFGTPVIDKFAVLLANGQLSKDAAMRFLYCLQTGNVLTGNMNPYNAATAVVTELLGAIDATAGIYGADAPASSLSDWSKTLQPFERTAKALEKVLKSNSNTMNSINNPYGVDPVSIGY